MSSATIHHFSSYSSPHRVMMNGPERDHETPPPGAIPASAQSTVISPSELNSIHQFSSGAAAAFAGPRDQGRDEAAPIPAGAAHSLTSERPEPAVHHNPSPSVPLASNIGQDHPHATRQKREHTELSPTQTEVIAQLAAGASVSAAARAIGVHRTTIHHWQRTSADFNTALEEARTEYAEALNDEMHDLACESVRTLRDLLTNPNTPPAVRLRTALAILERPQFPHPGWHLPD